MYRTVCTFVKIELCTARHNGNAVHFSLGDRLRHNIENNFHFIVLMGKLEEEEFQFVATGPPSVSTYVYVLSFYMK